MKYPLITTPRTADTQTPLTRNHIRLEIQRHIPKWPNRRLISVAGNHATFCGFPQNLPCLPWMNSHCLQPINHLIKRQFLLLHPK